MKLKPTFLIGLLFLTTVFVTGCTRCVTCTDCNSGTQLESEELCESDFNSKEDFDQAVDLAESFGCTCLDG